MVADPMKAARAALHVTRRMGINGSNVDPSAVDRALAMTRRGGFAGGGAPNFGSASRLFQDIPDVYPVALSQEVLNGILSPRVAYMGKADVPLDTTYVGSNRVPVFGGYHLDKPDAGKSSSSDANDPYNKGSAGGMEGGGGKAGDPGGEKAQALAEIDAVNAGGGQGAGSGIGLAARGGRIHRKDGGETYKDPESRKIAGWHWRPLSEVQEQLGGLHEIPSHVANFGQFMDETARRAATHGLTPRDLIKAYTITRSSIQRESRSADKARASGVNIPHDFTGNVRPEGAFGEWLHSPMGRRYLDAAERGVVDHESIADAVKVMKPFGLSTEVHALPWAAKNLPQHASAVSDMVARAMQSKSSPEEWRNFVSGVHGIGSAKAGFMASLLGRGDQPTLDARQIVLHTGKPTKEAKLPLARAGHEAVDRLAARQSAMGLKTPEGMEPYYQHLSHHAVWDKVGNEQTTHQDVINAMRHAATGGAINSAYEHPLAEAMREIGLPGLGTHRDGFYRGGSKGAGLSPDDALIQAALERVVSPFEKNPEKIKQALAIAAGYKTPTGNRAPNQTGSYYNIKHELGASDVNPKISNIPGVNLNPKREMTWEDLFNEGKGGSFINVGGDRSNLGVLTHINNQKLAWPVELHAGPKYMQEPNPGAVWANNITHASGFRNAVLKAAEKGPVYGVYAPMGTRAVDSSHNMFDAVMAQIPNHNIDPKAMAKFDNDIKEAKFLPANYKFDKNVVKEKMKDWPGLANPREASDFARGIGGVHRSAIIKHMDKAEWHKAGFPAIGMTRAAITDPDVFNTPSNMIGHRVVKFNPENLVAQETAMKHSTYTHPTSGEYVGDIPFVQRQYAMPDVAERLLKNPTKKGEVVHPYSTDPLGRATFRKMTEENKQIQPINQRMLDSAQLGLQRQSSYGLKRGGATTHAIAIARKVVKEK